jgi:hypothetical protein
MTMIWEPFRGFEIMSKLTEGPKNRPETFVEPWRPSVSCSSHTTADRPETIYLIVISSIASTLGSLPCVKEGV